MRRRELIKGLAALAPMPLTAGRVWAAPKSDVRLLVVFALGGYFARRLGTGTVCLEPDQKRSSRGRPMAATRTADCSARPLLPLPTNR